MNTIKLIIIREYLSKVRTKSFVVMTFLSPILVIALFMMIIYLKNMNDSTQVKNIAVLAPKAFSNVFQNTPNIHFDYWEKTLPQAKADALEKKYYGLLYIDEKQIFQPENNVSFFTQEAPSVSLVEKIRNELQEKIFSVNLEKKGIDKLQVEQAKANIHLLQQNFTGDENSEKAVVIYSALALIAAYFLMMFIVMYGTMTMRSVIEEKTNRIVEIIVSSVKPYQLMMGKIIGVSLAGITQFVVWLFFAGLIMFVLSQTFGVSPSSTNEILFTKTGTDRLIAEYLVEFFNFPIMQLVFLFFVYFVGGYLLYSSFYASIGAAVDSETDTQQFVMPLIMPLVFSIYLGSAIVLDSPHGMVSVVFSMIPLTSPVIMLMRIPFGVPLWQIALSLTLLYSCFVLSIRLAAKIYRVGILMYGKKATYKEILKWIRTKY